MKIQNEIPRFDSIIYPTLMMTHTTETKDLWEKVAKFGRFGSNEAPEQQLEIPQENF